MYKTVYVEMMISAHANLDAFMIECWRNTACFLRACSSKDTSLTPQLVSELKICK